jgi:glycolate oxidase
MTTINTKIDIVLHDLKKVLSEDQVTTAPQARFQRTIVPAPFPIHRIKDYMPDIVVFPESREDVVQIVKIANRHKIAIVPRGGGTGLTDGAVPLRRGIIVDMKRMKKIIEVDLENRTVTVQPGINMLKLNEHLAQYGLFYPDDPASYPVATLAGRIGTSGLSLIGARYGHTRDLVISLEVVLPTGEVFYVGEGGGKKIRKSSSGFRLKDLFIGHQGTLGITTEVTLELVKLPEAVFPAFFMYDNFTKAYHALKQFTESGVSTMASCILFDERKVAYLRRDDEAWIPAPDWLDGIICVCLYGYEDEVEIGKKRIMEIAERTGGVYAGEEVSEGDWASRHDRYATPLHGRKKDGQVVRMSWHCEDAAINYSELLEVKRKWHKVIDELIEKYEIFDNWGMFFYSQNSFFGHGDYLVEIDVGIQDQLLDDETWKAWSDAKKEISRIALEHGGSMSSCHGSTRDGEVELIADEMGYGYEIMKMIKRNLDPNNIMNPGKYLLDCAYDKQEERG